MEAPRLLAQFWVSAQGIGSREVWPRYAFCEAYRVAPQGYLFRGLGALAAILFVLAGLYRVELFTWTSYLAQVPPPGAISAPFGTRPRRIRR